MTTGTGVRKGVVAVLVSAALVGCGIRLPTTCPAGAVSGMIIVQTAVLSGTGAPLTPVFISNVTRDGTAITAREAVGVSTVGGQVSGVRVEGDTLVCDVSCQFATPGHYTFDVGAAGALTQHIDVNIPPRDAGGCGGITTGTPVTLNLRFVAAPHPATSLHTLMLN